MSKFLGVFENHISSARLAPYLRTTGDMRSAVEMYEWNATASAAFWKDIGHLEVLVRNALHRRLTSWSIENFGQPRWYLDPGKVLSVESATDVMKARSRLKRLGKPDEPGRVVAELSFGFWRFLVAKRYDGSLWVPTLRYSFPHLMGHGRRNDLHKQLVKLHDLRNRLAHHEPIHNRPLHTLHTALTTVAGWIDPHMCDWIKQQSTMQQQLATRPTIR